MEKTLPTIFLLSAAVVIITLSPTWTLAQNAIPKSVDSQMAIEKTEKLIQEVVEESYPELLTEKIKVKTFRSQKTFFKAQFSFNRYLTLRKLRMTILINPIVYSRNAPVEGLRAILAHELAHILYYKRKNRLQLLGLIGLVNGGFNAKFERRTDLVAIERGYGIGLIEYREWLYQNVSEREISSKKRNYFTSEEIALLIAAFKKNPEIVKILKKKVPGDLDEVKKSVGK